MFLQKTPAMILSLSLLAALQVSAQQEPVPEAAMSAERAVLASTLTEFTGLGNNALYNRIITPGKSLNTAKSDSDRTSEANALILGEIDQVISAFKSAGEAQKLDAVRAVLNSIDSKILRNKGVNIQFIQGEPSAAINRNFLMIEKAGNARVTAEELMKTITSYRRSARPSDHAYEYSQADNLTQATIHYTKGNDETWKPPQAPAPMETGKDYAIKKCRQIFGWRCATSVYRTDQALEGVDHVKYFYTGSYSLKTNPDNAEFKGDGRTRNQVEGSTNMLVVKESAGWILMYSVDSQWNDDKISFGSMIQDGAEKDFARFKERVGMDLGISADKIK